jgi:hypothetical protein
MQCYRCTTSSTSLWSLCPWFSMIASQFQVNRHFVACNQKDTAYFFFPSRPALLLLLMLNCETIAIEISDLGAHFTSSSRAGNFGLRDTENPKQLLAQRRHANLTGLVGLYWNASRGRAGPQHSLSKSRYDSLLLQNTQKSLVSQKTSSIN